ncbi:MAG: ADP-ribosylglycohydrolase family protein [Cyanobacteriota bacterium]|nr:ADP-ribosylglycohydrolase family protein [Cyanobacteriota bacterium]
MRYSLTSRIRGALVGALLGQSLATTKDKQPIYCRAAVQGICSLVESQGEFNVEEYNQKLQQQDWDSDIPDDLMLLNLILATLPIALFFHENHLKLRENLLLTIKDFNHPLIRDGVLSTCYLIAQCLNEKINPNTLVSEITYFIGETTSYLPEKLHQVNNLIAKNAAYFELQNCLDKENNISNIIAAAFYCFISTEEDFRLTCLRAIENQANSQVCGAIAGAISGAYNSMAGIPITWHLELDEAKLAQWGLTSFSQVVKLADALMAVWSGAYHVSPQPIEVQEVEPDLLSSLEAIAAPRIIRLR